MGQKDGEKWTAAVDSQPTLPKPDRLLGLGGAAAGLWETAAMRSQATSDVLAGVVKLSAAAVGRLRPLAELPPARLARLRGVLTDIDDTLTRDGAI